MNRNLVTRCDSGEPGLGTELGRGVRSIIYRWGSEHAIKVPNPSTPWSWIVEEHRLACSAARSGAPVPGDRHLVDLDGRPCLVCLRVDGLSMWELLHRAPSQAESLGGELARVQRRLFSLVPSYELPDQRDRLTSKIWTAAHQHGSDLAAAIGLMPVHTGDMVICHGDLHPSNVMCPPDGTVVVDWFDACRGSAVAEVARTALVLEPGQAVRLATSSTTAGDAIARFRHAYLADVCDALRLSYDDVSLWGTVQRVARLAEGFGVDQVEAVRAEVGRRATERR